MMINTGKNIQPQAASVTHTNEANSKASSKALASADSVTLSQTATKAASASSEGNAIDQDRVADIKQSIAEGRYRINADMIAQKMLNQDELF